MIQEIKELFQDIIAPQLEALKGDIRALDAKIGGVDTKVESYHRELRAEIRSVGQTLSAELIRLENKLDVGLAALEKKTDARHGSLESKVDVSLNAMSDKLVFLRNELLAEIRASSRP